MKPSQMIMDRMEEKARTQFQRTKEKMRLGLPVDKPLLIDDEDEYVRHWKGWYASEAIMEHLDHIEADLIEALEKLNARIDRLMEPVK